MVYRASRARVPAWGNVGSRAGALFRELFEAPLRELGSRVMRVRSSVSRPMVTHTKNCSPFHWNIGHERPGIEDHEGAQTSYFSIA